MNNRLLVSTALALALSSTAMAQTKWDLPAAYPATNFHTENLVQFANDVDKALSLFEPKIAEEPADVAAAARAYIDTRRDEFAAKRNRTYSATERAVTNMALGTLDQLCGLSDS
jgi:hypothetical protein